MMDEKRNRKVEIMMFEYITEHVVTEKIRTRHLTNTPRKEFEKSLKKGVKIISCREVKK